MPAFHHLKDGIPVGEPAHFDVHPGRGLLRPAARFRGRFTPGPGLALVAAPGDARGHALMMIHAQRDSGLTLIRSEGAPGTLLGGPFRGEPAYVLHARTDAEFTGPALLPVVAEVESGRIVADDALDIARTLAPDLFPPDRTHDEWVTRITTRLLDGALALGLLSEQRAYEQAYARFETELRAVEAHLTERRYLLGTKLSFADFLLFAFCARLDSVYFPLYKANPCLLEDLPALHGFARDLYERTEVHTTTDFYAIVAYHHLAHPTLDPRALLPRGGRPELDAPHFRADVDPKAGVEEKPSALRATGEFVRGRSGHRAAIVDDSEADFPAVAGRYHLYAPYNCPWSHRALLARSVLGLDDVVSATVVSFRRHPERGWQMNPALPGCDADPVGGHRFIRSIYEQVGSEETSVPILYDTVSEQIVNNESADILRMFGAAFGALATRPVDLYPAAHRDEIDRLNELIYQRINNGAYKAGFARSQHPYDRAFARYFAGLDWLEKRLADRDFLVGTAHPTEADLRLFPTLFRHDAVYYARFRLNKARVRDYPRLEAWLARMMAWPGVAEASNLDHARNGYFGRSGNGVVPAGPVPLGLSSKDYPRTVWLGDAEPPVD